MAQCKDCKGRGSWSVMETGIDGETELVHHFCFTCNGSGKDQSDDEIDDFDLAGVGVTEDDD